MIVASHNLIYAGIGSRKTPVAVQHQMRQIAEQLSPVGWQLRSGHADGADKAFERGAVHKEIHLPWPGFNNQDEDGETYFIPTPTAELVEITARNHPMPWNKMGFPVKSLMMRNTTIMLGLDLQTPVKFVVCWTQDGKEEGGTSHALRIARDPIVVKVLGSPIPVFNLANPNDITNLVKFVVSYEKD